MPYCPTAYPFFVNAPPGRCGFRGRAAAGWWNNIINKPGAYNTLSGFSNIARCDAGTYTKNGTGSLFFSGDIFFFNNAMLQGKQYQAHHIPGACFQ